MERTGLDFALEKTAGIYSAMGKMKDAYQNTRNVVYANLKSDNLEKVDRAVGTLSNATSGIAKGAITGILGAYGLKKVIDGLLNDHKRKAMLEDLIMNDSTIKQADPDKVKEFYATIHYMAPRLSCDKNIVRELLQNFIKFDRVDIASIKALADTQKSMLQGESQLMKSVFGG